MRAGPDPGMPDGPGPGAAREAATLFQAGLIILPLLALGLVLGTGADVLDAVFIAALLGTLPLLSLAQVPLLVGTRVERSSAYLGSTVTLLVLGSLGLALGAVGPGLEAMGLSAEFGIAELQVTGLLLAAVALLGGAFHLAGELLGLDESPLLKQLIPRTNRERGMFALLSLAAGVGEEVVFRGYLIAVLGTLFSGPWTAALVSSLAFSLLHAYQGGSGIVRSGLLGFLFAAAFILHGSLWPLILVHAAVDLFSGLVLGPRMLSKETL